MIYSSYIIGIIFLSKELRILSRVCLRVRRSSGGVKVQGPKKSPFQEALETIYTIHRVSLVALQEFSSAQLPMGWAAEFF